MRSRAARDFMEALYQGCQGLIELRTLPSKARAFFALDAHDAIEEWCRNHRNENNYLGVSTRKDKSSGTAENCLHLAAFFADLDFSTHGEAAIRDRLARFPLAPSAVVGSGGGLHPYFFLREPIPAASASKWLQRLAADLDGDPKCAEVARVLRVPNTLNHKAKYVTPRRVEIEHLDPSCRYNPSEFDEWLPSLPTSPVQPLSVPETIPQGERNDTLYRLCRSLNAKGVIPAAIRAAAVVVNQQQCVPPLDTAEVEQIVRSAVTQPSRVLSRRQDDPVHRTLSLTAASAVQVRPVRWLWQDRLPLDALSLLGGREGVGKTILADTLAADTTRGRLPGVHEGTPRGVIVAATEDSWEHTIGPRLIAAGADLDRVYRVDVVTSDGVGAALSLPTDLPALQHEITRSDIVLVILDPLLSRLDSKLDTHKDAEVRLALEPLVALAHATNISVLGLIHVNKTASNDPLTLLMGSRAFVAVARSVLFVMTDPDDEATRLLGQAKNNLGRTDLPTLTFRIEGAQVAETEEGPVWTGKLEWTGTSGRTITDAVESATESSGNRTATSEAADWLKDALTSQGGTADSAAVKAEGKRAGHSLNAIKRARKQLRVVSTSLDFPRRTVWSLPTGGPLPGETDPIGLTGPTGTHWDGSGVQSGPAGPVGEPPQQGVPTGKKDADDDVARY